MFLKRFIMLLAVAMLAVGSLACGDKAAKKVATEAPREGRDRELFTDGLDKLRKARYEQGRLLLNTMISTYDNSGLLPMAKLLIADSFYREGGSSNLAQAEVEYRDWLQFFPQHELADDVLLKIAEIHVRGMDTYNRDWTKGLAAERELMRLQKEYPSSDLNPQVAEYLTFVREQLGMHELNIARHYFKVKKAWNAVEGRAKNIVKKYPDFTYMDEALFLLGSALVEKENTPEAATYFARLVREYPNSEYRDRSAEMLEKFGVKVPEPQEGAVEKLIKRKGLIGRKWEEIIGPGKHVSDDGILLTRKDQVDPRVLALLEQQKENVSTPDSRINDSQTGKSQTYGQKLNGGAQAVPVADKQPAPKASTTPTVKDDKKKKDRKKESASSTTPPTQ